MVLPNYQPIKCANGVEIPQSHQTDGLFPSEIQKLCEDSFLIMSTTLQSPGATPSTSPTSTTTSTIFMAIVAGLVCFLLLAAVLLAVKYRKNGAYARMCDCITMAVGGLFCCLCDKRLQREKNNAKDTPVV